MFSARPPEKVSDYSAMKESMAILFGNAGPRIEGHDGKTQISYHKEHDLLEILRYFPRGVPIRDMISPEMYGETFKAKGFENSIILILERKILRRLSRFLLLIVMTTRPLMIWNKKARLISLSSFSVF